MEEKILNKKHLILLEEMDRKLEDSLEKQKFKLITYSALTVILSLVPTIIIIGTSDVIWVQALGGILLSFTLYFGIYTKIRSIKHQRSIVKEARSSYDTHWGSEKEELYELDNYLESIKEMMEENKSLKDQLQNNQEELK